MQGKIKEVERARKLTRGALEEGEESAPEKFFREGALPTVRELSIVHARCKVELRIERDPRTFICVTRSGR